MRIGQMSGACVAGPAKGSAAVAKDDSSTEAWRLQLPLVAGPAKGSAAVSKDDSSTEAWRLQLRS